MNRMLGTKWFTFYTKVRPAIAVLASFTVISDFFQYTSVYFYYWWLLLSFLMVIAQLAFCILVAVKSSKDYADFVRFVKGVLLFESFNIAYQQGVQAYSRNMDFVQALLLTAFVFVICYFVWYKLNMKYFTKRLLTNSTNILPAQEIDNVAGKKQEMTTMPIPRIQYCRHCGAKISGESNFCNICGVRIAEEGEKE